MAIIWTVFDDCELRTEKDVEGAVNSARARLLELPRGLLGEFRNELKHAISVLDLSEFRKLPLILSSGDMVDQSVDSFLYARCACILSGRKAYEDAVIRRKFDGHLRVVLQGAESILYLAEEVTEELGSSGDTRLSDFEQGFLDIGDGKSMGDLLQ